jgi:transposase
LCQGNWKTNITYNKEDYITNFGKWETRWGDGFARPTICRSL